MNCVCFTLPDQLRGIINAGISLDAKLLHLFNQLFVLRSQNFTGGIKCRLVLLPVIRSVTVQQNDDSADLEDSIIEKLEGSFFRYRARGERRIKILSRRIEHRI